MLRNSLWGVWEAIQYDSFVWLNGLRAADKIATHMTGPEKRRLFELVVEHQPKVVLEIGSFLGASTCFMARACQRRTVKGRIHAVDTWNNDAMPEGCRDTFAEFQANTRPYLDVLSALRQPSVEAAKTFAEQIDLLFIDGDHEYLGVKADWDAWSGHLAPEAIVVMHDCGWADGVNRVISEDVSPRTQWEDRLPNLYWAQMKPE